MNNKEIAYYNKTDDGYKIELNNIPSDDLLNKIWKFINSKNGAFIDNNYKVFVIKRNLSSKHVQRLFDLLDINLEVFDRDINSFNFDPNTARRLNEFAKSSFRLSFGEYKGNTLEEVPKHYLKFLMKGSMDKAIAAMAKDVYNKNYTKRI